MAGALIAPRGPVRWSEGGRGLSTRVCLGCGGGLDAAAHAGAGVAPELEREAAVGQRDARVDAVRVDLLLRVRVDLHLDVLSEGGACGDELRGRGGEAGSRAGDGSCAWRL